LIRTFIAVPVPDRVKRVKQMLFSTLENEKVKIKWVRNMQIHLTLKFLGFTPDRSVNRLKLILANVIAKYEPFDLTIRNTGCFPLPSRPRVLWLDVNDETNKLDLLVNDLEKVLEVEGFPKSDQQFAPHITLARIRYPQKYTPNISRYLQSSYDEINLPLNRVQFFSSELLPDGAVHTLLGTFPLDENY
jgi:2'-5' RNA ligase